MRPIETARLVLEPLVVAHAEQMFEVLNESLLYRFLDNPPPPSIEHLRGVYSRLESRASPSGSQLWLNWALIPRGKSAIGYVQATIIAGEAAWVAYLLASKAWGRGYATEAMQGMLAHLAISYDVVVCRATVEAENQASIHLLERLAFNRASAQDLEDHVLSPTERLFVKHLRGEQNVL